MDGNQRHLAHSSLYCRFGSKSRLRGPLQQLWQLGSGLGGGHLWSVAGQVAPCPADPPQHAGFNGYVGRFVGGVWLARSVKSVTHRGFGGASFCLDALGECAVRCFSPRKAG